MRVFFGVITASRPFGRFPVILLLQASQWIRSARTFRPIMLRADEMIE
jgi:hypothetical protein